jgi:2'-5' RNA ligase
MPHRIFIAINLPEKVKQSLFFYQSKWPELPSRWTRKENLHITLVFIGYVRDEELPDICNVVRETASKNKPFSIILKRICYGPTDKKPVRMVWAEGEKSAEVAKLQRDLENSLTEGVPRFEGESRAYSPHITLARLKTWEFKAMEPTERPEISEDISLDFEVNSVELMESHLKRSGAEYSVLESFPLKG